MDGKSRGREEECGIGDNPRLPPSGYVNIGRRPESLAASITRCRPQAKPRRLPAMSGETRGKTPRPRVKGTLCGSSRATPDKLYEEAISVVIKKSQGAGAVSVAGVRARLSPLLSRSRHPPFLAVSGTLCLIHSDDANPMLLTTTKDLFEILRNFSSPAPALPRLTEARSSRDPPLFSCDAADS